MAWTGPARERVGAFGCGGGSIAARIANSASVNRPPQRVGRPRTTDVRAVLDGIFHVLRTGCQWRHLPPQFPPWQTTYAYLRAWMAAGVWDEVLAVLRIAAREAAGREASPSAAVIDSQSVKTTEKGGLAAGMRRSA
jgi:putative transposase